MYDAKCVTGCGGERCARVHKERRGSEGAERRKDKEREGETMREGLRKRDGAREGTHLVGTSHERGGLDNNK